VSREGHPRDSFVYRELTVARFDSPEDADYIDVMFLESARIYRLFRATTRFGDLLERLRAADAAHRPVAVGLASVDGDVIEDVRELPESSG